MKLRSLIVLASTLFFLAGCINVTDEPSDIHGSAHEDPGSVEKSPAIGMTQSEIRDIYGEPDSVDRSPCCEVWYYWFKSRHVFIPADPRTRARNGVFIFGDNGKLKDFGYNQ